MRLRPRENGQILILLAAWLFFGGGGTSALVVYDRPASEMKTAIKHAIPNSDRRDALLYKISVWEAGQKQKAKKAGADREQLFKTLRRKDAQRSDAEPLMARLDATFLEMDQSLINLRFRVKDQVTSAEWAEIAARPNR
jgi:hypothetical protein